MTQAKDAKGKDIYTRRENDPTQAIFGLDPRLDIEAAPRKVDL